MDIKDVLKANNFHFNKALGQNFITDTNLLDAICADAGIEKTDTVVEIGCGAGTLTERLARASKRVVSFEVDENLKPILAQTLKGCDNVQVCFMDVLKMSDKEIVDVVGDGAFKVVANLPYYVTTAMVMRFLESDLDVLSLTVMVQHEVARRFTASAGTSDYGAITLGIQLAGDAKITRSVSRKMFFPVPNVDSAVVRIDVDKARFDPETKKKLSRLIKSAFHMRRKTLSNNLMMSFGLSRDEAAKAIEAAGFSALVRGETLTLADFVKLADCIK